jgi:predicted dehydrogenase
MADKLRWGILGNATIGRKCVMPAIRKSTNGKIRALGTRRPDAAGEIAKQNRIERVYGDYESVLRDPEVEAVYIPLPNHLHRPWTLKALAAGKHVLCEKPLGCSAEQAREMAAAARGSGLVLMEALMYRFHPRTRRVKGLIGEGAVGTPRLVRAAFCFSMAPELLESGDNCRLQPKMGGGALLDVGSYAVSVARWFLEAEPAAVQAQAVYRGKTEVDIHLVGTLRFPGGALATVEASFCAGLQQTYTVVGSGGAVELPHDAFIPWEKDAAVMVRGKDEETGKTLVVPGADEYRLMVEHFADRVRTGKAPTVSVEDSIGNLVALDAMAEAARTGRTVFISQEDPSSRKT